MEVIRQFVGAEIANSRPVWTTGKSLFVPVCLTRETSEVFWMKVRDFFRVTLFGFIISAASFSAFGVEMDGCMPRHIDSHEFKYSNAYDQYNNIYSMFVREYSKLIRYVYNNGDSKEADALLKECRLLASSDRWSSAKLLNGVGGQLYRGALSNLGGDVLRVVRKISSFLDSREHRSSVLKRKVETDTGTLERHKINNLEQGFSTDFVMQRKLRMWTNVRGKTMNGEWHFISENGDTVWLYDVEKKKYVKMPMKNLSVGDQDDVKKFVGDCLALGMRWKCGTYMTSFEMRELSYLTTAREKIEEKSIRGTKDIQVIQAWEYGGLCNYGVMGSYFRSENSNLIYWQTGEKGMLANGDILRNQQMIWAGTMKYETVNKTINTVSCYCNNFAFALKLVRIRLHLYDDGDNRFDDSQHSPQPNNRPHETGNVPLAYGSGFFVTKDGYLVTNSHVIKGAKKMFAITKDGRHEVSLVGEDTNTDLALLKANGVFEPVAFSPNRMEKLGTTIFTSGFPMPSSQGFSPKVTKGIVSGEKGMNDNPVHYQIDASIQPGNSGGPVCDEYGNVIAVVVATLSGKYYLENKGTIPQNVNYAIKKAYLEAFLGNYLDYSGNLKKGGSEKIDFSAAVDKVKPSIALIEVY